MDFSELIRSRYSVRAYKQDPVEDDKLNRVLEAARLAPTAANRQPFKIIVINTRGREKELNRVYSGEWFAQAPIVICVCVIPQIGWTRSFDAKNHCDVDAAIVMDHLILAAANEGLGTCWIGAFDPAAAREVLHLPDELEPVVFTPLGYSADQPRVKKRKELAELVQYQ
ncbi:MAG: nitroreductase family protein [Armatimonadota bacterium]|nr:nitroreductase family protein [bacterium]